MALPNLYALLCSMSPISWHFIIIVTRRSLLIWSYDNFIRKCLSHEAEDKWDEDGNNSLIIVVLQFVYFVQPLPDLSVMYSYSVGFRSFYINLCWSAPF